MNRNNRNWSCKNSNLIMNA